MIYWLTSYQLDISIQMYNFVRVFRNPHRLSFLDKYKLCIQHYTISGRKSPNHTAWYSTINMGSRQIEHIELVIRAMLIRHRNVICRLRVVVLQAAQGFHCEFGV